MSRLLGGLLQKAQGLKEKAKKVKAELKAMTVESSAGNGAVKVVANGDKQIISIKLNKELLENPEDIESLKDLIFTASNDALSKAGVIQKDAAKKVLGEMGLNIPGIF